MFPRRRKLEFRRREQGFLIPMALFILVGMLALALASARLVDQSGTGATLEAVSTQAFYAAESGGQYAVYQVFNGAADQAGADANCDGLATVIDYSSGSAPGLQTCEASVSCTRTAADGISFYTVTSTGSCGTGVLSAEREIQIKTFMK